MAPAFRHHAVLPCELPIVQAPLAGGPSTPALTAAVTRAGGYGFVASGYLSAAEFTAAVRTTREVAGPIFGVNVFVPSTPGDRAEIEAYGRALEPDAERLGVALGEPRFEDDEYEAKLEVAKAERVHLVSFVFGCPASDVVDQLHAVDALVAVTVTTAPEAERAVGAGSDVLVVQGSEAGGHQGGFLDPGARDTPLTSLLGELREMTSVPLLAAGGIMTGNAAAAALRAGAVAVVLGTALLCTPEAGTSALHRQALLDGRYPDTIVTRAYTGRFARGLANDFALAHDSHAPRAYPEVHHLTRPLRVAASAAGDSSVPNLWAGTGWRQITTDPAATVVRRVASDL
ncbi:MAG TPA: nitronate monooxygenase [Acidimicrobiales bacterium]|nr:nitronate monooxygenase [Acidimicrobiales bacterium]